MQRIEAEKMARYWLDYWGLKEVKFEWMRKKRVNGEAHYRARILRLSVHYVDNNSPELVKDTILHEIAHFKAWDNLGEAGRGHGVHWKRWCMIVGANPNRCKKTNAQYNFYVVCSCCNKVVGKRFRRSNLNRYVSVCCKKPLSFKEIPNVPVG